jgi:hypothetical protein
MRLWKRTALALGAATLLSGARAAQAQQVWIGPGGQVALAPSWQVGPAWQVGPTWQVGGPWQPAWQPAWQAGPAWGVRRYYGPFRRPGWYGAVRGPRGGVVVGRRW